MFLYPPCPSVKLPDRFLFVWILDIPGLLLCSCWPWLVWLWGWLGVIVIAVQLEVRDVLDLSRLYLEDGQREFGGVGSGIVIFVISQLVGQRSREWDTSPWC